MKFSLDYFMVHLCCDSGDPVTEFPPALPAGSHFGFTMQTEDLLFHVSHYPYEVVLAVPIRAGVSSFRMSRLPHLQHTEVDESSREQARAGLCIGVHLTSASLSSQAERNKE